ncbi:hypothetical protein F5Y06DRAFT_307485 [Hypoxylon sp. FL0890]|nr:hypothetical protein F5Y06DRAFT_307485 [Hypoxylon sp. FL0890]
MTNSAMDRSNDATPNGVHQYPQYDSRFPPRFGGDLLSMLRPLWPQTPSVVSDISSVVYDNPETPGVIGQERTPIATLGARPSEHHQPRDVPNTSIQPIGPRPFNLGFASAFMRPNIRPPFARPPRDMPDDDGYIPMGQWPPRFPNRFLHPSIWEQQLQITGISHNYGGNIFLESNQSANIPEDQSTSLWLTNLPPDCTHQLLLGSIRRCGKIYATVINPPVQPNNSYAQGARHMTAASKLVFFDRSGLDRLVAKSRMGDFTVGEFVPRIRMNRIKSAPRMPGPQSRVLHIEGPSSIVNEKFLNTFFQTKFTYELDRVITMATTGDWTRQEWRFGSFRCQAESARQSIAREKIRRHMPEDERLLWSKVVVHFGVDPCA